MLEKDNPLDRKLDATFKQKLDDLDFPFREQEWEAMRQKIQPNNRKRTAFWVSWLLCIGILGVGKSYLPTLPAIVQNNVKAVLPTKKQHKQFPDTLSKNQKTHTFKTTLIKFQTSHKLNPNNLLKPILKTQKSTNDSTKTILQIAQNYDKLNTRGIQFPTFTPILKPIDSLKIFEKPYKRTYRLGISVASGEGVGIRQEFLFHRHGRLSAGASYNRQFFSFPIELAYQMRYRTWSFRAFVGILPTIARKKRVESAPNALLYALSDPNTANHLPTTSSKNALGSLMGIGAEKYLHSHWLVQTQIQYRHLSGKGNIQVCISGLYQF